MKQYCRYCANCVYGDVLYCKAHEKVMSESYTKRTNKCKDFVSNPIDVFNIEKVYQPRERTKKQEQIKIVEGQQ